ncbi:MAG: hypothetical protein ABF727_11240 [Gluconobacter oxydans]
MKRKQKTVLELHVVMCEQVRPEAKGTINLIGVYAAGIRARDPEKPVAMSFWCNYRVSESWRGLIKFRLVDGDDIVAEDEFDLTDLPHSSGYLNFPPVFVPGSPKRDVKLQWTTDTDPDAVWTTTKTVRITSD